MYKRCRLVSFDGGVQADVSIQRPDRYRQLEAAPPDLPLIARGGGYAYAAASFGEGSVTQDMRCFDRLLSFDSESGEVEVEAGVTLGKLLSFAAPRGFWLPQLPGYPDITVGGAIAANVHGKSPSRDGTFRQSVLRVTLFHTRKGWVNASPSENEDLFQLTIGGFGLTGTIVKALLRLQPLGGGRVITETHAVASIAEAFAELSRPSSRHDFAYTWHNGAPTRGRFGKGLVITGSIEPGSPVADPLARSYRILPSMPTKGRLPVTVWGGWRTALLNSVFLGANRMRPRCRRESLFDSVFPFARKPMYFRLYGQTGLIESQILVPHAEAPAFAAALEEEILRHQPPVVFVSCKAMGGKQSLLRFEGPGFSLAVNMVRDRRALAFLAVLDELVLQFRAIPSLIKDSRLPRVVVERCYPELKTFRRLLRQVDPSYPYASELSRRLALCAT